MCDQFFMKLADFAFFLDIVYVTVHDLHTYKCTCNCVLVRYFGISFLINIIFNVSALSCFIVSYTGVIGFHV